MNVRRHLATRRRWTGLAAALALGAAGALASATPAAAADLSNGGFESGGLSGWAPVAGSAVSLTQTNPHGGTGNAAAISRKPTSTTAGQAGITDAPDQFTGLAAGTVCTASAWVRGPSGFKGSVKWIAKNGTTTVATVTKNIAFAADPNTWVRTPVATLNLPANATSADLQVVAPAFPAGSTWFADDVTASCTTPTGPPPMSYVAHWLLNESGTPPPTAFDDVNRPNGNNGTPTGGVTGDGQTYTFNGVDGKVVVPSSTSLNPGTKDFSYGVTLKMTQPPPAGDTYDVLRKGTTTTAGGEYKLEISNSSGQAFARCVVKDENGVVTFARATTDLLGASHAVTCTKIGNKVTVAIDGAIKATKTATSPTIGSVSNSATLALGSKGENTATSGFDWYRGEMSDAFVKTS
jgi:hypothetical protein